MWCKAPRVELNRRYTNVNDYYFTIIIIIIFIIIIVFIIIDMIFFPFLM